MSHLSIVKTKVKAKDMEVLKNALENVASSLGAKLQTGGTISIYGGQRYSADFVIDKGRGIGIDVDEQGNIKIKADFYYLDVDEVQLKGMIEKEYMTEATKKALLEMGFDVQVEAGQTSNLLVGVRL